MTFTLGMLIGLVILGLVGAIVATIVLLRLRTLARYRQAAPVVPAAAPAAAAALAPAAITVAAAPPAAPAAGGRPFPWRPFGYVLGVAAAFLLVVLVVVLVANFLSGVSSGTPTGTSYDLSWLNPALWPEHLRAWSATWSPQTWAALITLVMALALRWLVGRGAALTAVAVALLLFILPWNFPSGFSTAGGTTGSPKIETVTLSKKPLLLNPDPNRKSLSYLVVKGSMKLVGLKNPFGESRDGDTFDQAAEGLVTHAVATTDEETVIQYQLCPSSHQKWGWC